VNELVAFFGHLVQTCGVVELRQRAPEVPQRSGRAQSTYEFDSIQTANEFERLAVAIPERGFRSGVVIPPALVQLRPHGSPELQIAFETSCQVTTLRRASGACQHLYQRIRFCSKCFVTQDGPNNRDCLGAAPSQFLLCEFSCRQNVGAYVRLQAGGPFGTILDPNDIRKFLLDLNDLGNTA
jgi:hypothetical protein